MASIITLHTYPTNDLVRGMAFKGPDIWMASPSPFIEQMTKATGVIIADHGTGAGGGTFQVLYDAVHDQFWATDSAGNNVTVLNGVGGLVSNPAVGNNPSGQVIANSHYWCANQGASSDATKLDAGTGAFIASVSIPAGPLGVANDVLFDGTDIWIPFGDHLAQISEAGATLLNTFVYGGVNFGGMTLALGFLWGTDQTTGNLHKISLAGALVTTFILPVASGGAITFDGTNFWIIDLASGTVNVVNPAGTQLASATLAEPNPQWVANDGTANQAWVTSSAPGPNWRVQLFQFMPDATGPGVFVGTFQAFITAGKFGGGTK